MNKKAEIKCAEDDTECQIEKAKIKCAEDDTECQIEKAEKFDLRDSLKS